MNIKKKAIFIRKHPAPFIGVIAGLTCLGFLGHLLHLGDYTDPDRLSSFLDDLRGNPWMPLILIGSYVAGGFFLFPVSILSLAIAMTFEPLLAVSISLTGALLNAVVFYTIGYGLHVWRLQKPVEKYMTKVKRLLDKGGVAGVAIVHMAPVAPFVVVNLCLGMLSVPFVTYLLGTFLALLPGMIIRSFLGDALRDVMDNPNMQSVMYIAMGVVAWLALLWMTHQLALRHQKTRAVKVKHA